MRRHLLGLIALAALVCAAVPYCFLPLAPYKAAGDMGLRIGLVLGALWLAWPELHRLPPWVWYVLPLGLVLFIVAKGILVYLIPAFVVAMVLYLLYRRVWRSPR